MRKKSELALEKHLSGYNCAQSVLYAFCEDLHLDADTALRLACGFGGGIARRQEVCGAVSGGILAISLHYGRGEGQDRAMTEETYGRIREFMSRFETRHGSILCRSLLNGCDLNTPEGQAYFKANDLAKVCKGCVATAADTAAEIIFQ